MGGKKKQIIGFKYYLGMHMVICHGPVDSIQKIIVGEREAWLGNATTSQTININSPNLFGGDKKEGGVVGDVDILMGEPTQAKNSYLMSKIQALVPAFRGVVSLVLKQCYVCAMSPYPKPWAVKVKRIPAKNWYSAKAEINGSANPIHVIYETLTNTDWGMGVSVALINDTSFRTAADTCYNESLGVSMLLSSQDSIEKFIYEVLGHCNGMFFIEPSSGKFAVKLLRDDYVAASLPVYDESNIVTFESFDRPTYSEIINEIIVTYRPQGSTSDDSVTVQDLASIQAQGGIVSQTSSYPGCDTAANANRLAMRDLRQKSTPLARVRLKVNRTAWGTAIGDVFRLSWKEHDLDHIVCRVLSINLGTIGSGTIMIDAAEDIFGLPLSTYVGNQGTLWTDPNQNPTNFPTRIIKEASYFELNDFLESSTFAGLDPTSAYALACAPEVTQYCAGFEFWDCSDNINYKFKGSSAITPTCLITTALTETQTSFTVSNFTNSAKLVKVDQYCYIDNEVVKIVSINFSTGAIVVGRGCFDTVPAKHNIGAMLVFAEAGQAFDSTEWSVGGTIYGRLLMRTSSALYALASASTTTLSMVGRFDKPYPPGQVKLNNQYYPSVVSGAFNLSWVGRDRTQQLVRPIIDHTAGNIGPEAGVTYRCDIYRSNGTTLIKSNVVTNPYTWPTEVTDTAGLTDSIQRIKLTSVRSGNDSYQSHDFYVERTGVGYDLGNYLGGV